MSDKVSLVEGLTYIPKGLLSGTIDAVSWTVGYSVATLKVILQLLIAPITFITGKQPDQQSSYVEAFSDWLKKLYKVSY